ncbi:MAG: hypothetical protein D6688_04380, partial [Alphaproteobacteria bacterium]
DRSDRERTRRIMELFNEEDSRDELGLGSIRDALADLLFPGTSTIQTRLRYMLFVPWIFRCACSYRGPAEERLSKARTMELRLVEALLAGGETAGVIGREARAGLKRLPSEIYWLGLGRLGIRRFPGGRADLLARDDTPGLWAAGLPEAPRDFLEKTTFALKPEEGDFLRDRLAASCADSVLAELARSGIRPEGDWLWHEPALAVCNPRNLRLVEHARRFSGLMQGAALLYNLQLAELAHHSSGGDSAVWQEKIQTYRQRLEDWRDEVSTQGYSDWKVSELWADLMSERARIPQLSRVFVEDWTATVHACAARVADDTRARDLVRQREIRLKRGKSRFRNAAALARWGGASGTARLSFRWPVARSHLRDLADAC